mgnify:FL=1
MKIIILGQTGLLGYTLNKYLKRKNNIVFSLNHINNNKKFYLTNINDFQKLKKIILNIKPDLIINCIVLKKENLNKKKITYDLINTKLPMFLSKLCLKNKIFFIHISTDSVFSDTNGNYSEKDIKNPKDIYSLSKRKGEVKNEFTTTLRTSFVGPEYNTKKALFSWFLNQKKQVNGFSNYYFTGLTTLEFCEIIYKFFIRENNLYNKILNIGGKKISKYDLLLKISKIFKKKIKIKIKTYPKINRTLNNNKFLKLSKYKVKNWDNMLKNLKTFMHLNNYKC